MPRWWYRAFLLLKIPWNNSISLDDWASGVWVWTPAHTARDTDEGPVSDAYGASPRHDQAHRWESDPLSLQKNHQKHHLAHGDDYGQWILHAVKADGPGSRRKGYLPNIIWLYYYLAIWAMRMQVKDELTTIWADVLTISRSRGSDVVEEAATPPSPDDLFEEEGLFA